MKNMFVLSAFLAFAALATPALAGGPQITVNGGVAVSNIDTWASNGSHLNSVNNTVNMTGNGNTKVSVNKNFDGKLTVNGSQMGSYITTDVNKGSYIDTMKNMVTMKHVDRTTVRLRD